MDKILEQLWLISNVLVPNWAISEMRVHVQPIRVIANIVWRDERSNLLGYAKIYVIYPHAESWLENPTNIVDTTVKRLILGNSYRKCYYLLSPKFKGYQYYIYEGSNNLRPQHIDSLLSYLLDECNGEMRGEYIRLKSSPLTCSMIIKVEPNYLPVVDMLGLIGGYEE